jgi:hypothetical protein
MYQNYAIMEYKQNTLSCGDVEHKLKHVWESNIGSIFLLTVCNKQLWSVQFNSIQFITSIDHYT